MTGRGTPGSKIQVLSERGGLLLSTAISAANTHDSHALKPLVGKHRWAIERTIA